MSLNRLGVDYTFLRVSAKTPYLVSDGARALVKLAVSGLDCVSVADLFHALRALGRPMGRALASQSAALHRQQDKLHKGAFCITPRKGAFHIETVKTQD